LDLKWVEIIYSPHPAISVSSRGLGILKSKWNPGKFNNKTNMTPTKKNKITHNQEVRKIVLT
jgi:hypothetical protein